MEIEFKTKPKAKSCHSKFIAMGKCLEEKPKKENTLKKELSEEKEDLKPRIKQMTLLPKAAQMVNSISSLAPP